MNYAELQRQQEQLLKSQRELSVKAPAASVQEIGIRPGQIDHGLDERISNLQNEYRTLQLKMEKQFADSESERTKFKKMLNDKMAEQEHLKKAMEKQKLTIEEQNKVINTVNDEIKRMKEMDLDAFISQEKQVLQKLSDEINSIKSSLKEARQEGELSPADAKLIKSGNYLKKQVEEINAAFSELDERLARVRNELVRVSTIEYKFKGVEDRLTAMQRNLENIIDVQLMAKSKEAVEYMESGKEAIVKDIQAIFAEQKGFIDDYESRLSTRITDVNNKLSKELAKLDSHFDERMQLLTDKQKEAEAAIDKKLEMDKEYSERLEDILKVMKK